MQQARDYLTKTGLRKDLEETLERNPNLDKFAKKTGLNKLFAENQAGVIDTLKYAPSYIFSAGFNGTLTAASLMAVGYIFQTPEIGQEVSNLPIMALANLPAICYFGITAFEEASSGQEKAIARKRAYNV
jgi:hypothetical protein